MSTVHMSTVMMMTAVSRVRVKTAPCCVSPTVTCHVSRGDTGSGTFNVETMDMFCVKQVSDYFYPDVIEILEAVRDGVQSGHPAASSRQRCKYKYEN